jgi:hypothetical protein
MKYNDFEYRYLTTLPDRWEQVECSFRVTGKVPELWNPITGETEEIVVYREENGRTIVPLLFEPEGSKFIIFRNAEQKPHITEIRKDNQSVFPEFSLETKKTGYINFRRNEGKVIAEISEPGNYSLLWSDGKKEELRSGKKDMENWLFGEWDIRFDPKWGAPANVKTEKLKSWTEFDEPGIKYYSGTATYHKTFKVSPAEMKQTRLVLDLGNVKEMASVIINGHQMQVLWSSPFKFDITQFVKSGDNELEVEVVNMWVNRLVGDGKLPENERITRTNINKFDAPDAEKYLRVSGLVGPVKIKIVSKYSLR